MLYKAKLQLYSLLALTALVVLLVGITFLVLKNIFFIVYVLFAFSLFGYAGWLVFSGIGKRLKLGKVLLTFAAVLLIGAIILFVNSDYELTGLSIMFLVAIMYVWIISRIQTEYWQNWASMQKNNSSKKFSKPYLIINPKAGNGRAIKANIKKLAINKNITVIVMKNGENLEFITRKIVNDGADIIGISSGDGSIGVVAKVALEFDIPIVVVPGGTRCHFAKDLGLDPKRIADSLDSFTGIERRVDIGIINSRIFLNNASFGLYADIISHENYRNNKLKVTRDAIRAMANGIQKPFYLEFSSNSKKYKKAAQVLVGVNAYNTMNILELGQRSCLDGGILQVTAISNLNDDIVRALLKPVSYNKLSRLNKMGMFEQWETKTFRISSKYKQIVVGVDGEKESFNNPVHIKIMPKALRIFVPAKAATSRPKNAFSLAIIAKLWQLAIGKHTD